MKGKDIINVRKSSIEADFPIGQKLSINGINCVVAKRGSCPNCIVCIPNVSDKLPPITAPSAKKNIIPK